MDKDVVAKFLADFKTKMKIYGIIYRDDRGKNENTLLLLEMPLSRRTPILQKLRVKDYCEGPIKDVLNNGTDMWVFGTNIKGFEIYIKITMGLPNRQTICISFHIAEYPIKYKFR